MLNFPANADSCYVVLKHRNHLGVMSTLVGVNSLVDFTLPTTPTFDFGTSLNNGYDYTNMSQKSNVIQDYMAMWAGDFDGNGKSNSSILMMIKTFYLLK